MVNLTNFFPEGFKADLYARPSEYETGGDPRIAFFNVLATEGFKIKGAIAIGKIERVPDPEDKGLKKSGWYFYNEFPDEKRHGQFIGIGVYGSWRDGAKKTWCSKTPHYLSADERKAYEIKLESARLASQAALQERQSSASVTARNDYDRAEPYSQHQYIQRKQVTPFHTKLLDGNVIVPVYDKGEVCSYQKIMPDGTKRFLSGGKTKGCYSIIAGNEKTVYIAEGFATAASIAMATGAHVYIAFNAGNIYEVTSLARSIHGASRIVIAGDDDYKSEGNVGKTKATTAAQAFNVEVIFPTTGHIDFNDMHVAEGLDTLTDYLAYRPEKITTSPDTSVDQKAFEPNGILAEIAAYYNATSGNDQRGFAVQTALALCSVILGRGFKTNMNNYTSMYFLNVAKSSTGKEHSKTVIESIIHAAGKEYLLAGDGYTSAGGVFSSLLSKPRHITIIDEFGRYLEASSRSGNSNQHEANTQLMQSISRGHGIMRPPNYSTMTLSKDKQDENQKRKVMRPAITIVSMTTPSTLFNSLDVNSISDGFLNRFVISISDAERKPREHKEHLEVPTKIIEWIEAIEDRKGSQSDIATEAPEEIVVTISSDAYKAQYEFQEHCIEIQNKLEEVNMSEIAGRSNEMAMKMALICALSRDPLATVVTLEDMKFSIEYIKHHLDALIKTIKLDVSINEHEADKKQILKAIRKAGAKGIAWSSMLKRPPYSKHKRKDLQDILVALQEAELIVEEMQKPEGRGRPAKHYTALN